MENKLQIFESKEFGKVRVLEIDGQPWWVLRDVCAALGLHSPHKVAERLDEDERNQIPVIDSMGRSQQTTIINESGLYAVILRSDKPKAKAFRRWITSEVLPTIRRHGAYITEETLARMLQSSEFTSELLDRLLAEREQNAVLRKHIEALAPKARYYDLILQSRNAVQVCLIAKDYGMTAVSFNQLLMSWVSSSSWAGPGFYISHLPERDIPVPEPIKSMRNAVLCIPTGHRLVACFSMKP